MVYPLLLRQKTKSFHQSTIVSPNLLIKRFWRLKMLQDRLLGQEVYELSRFCGTISVPISSTNH